MCQLFDEYTDDLLDPVLLAEAREAADASTVVMEFRIQMLRKRSQELRHICQDEVPAGSDLLSYMCERIDHIQVYS